MPYPQKYPLRALTEQEERALSRIAKARSERVDTVRRAKALLAVSAGEPFAVAARQSGFTSADSVSQLVQGFSQQGLAYGFLPYFFALAFLEGFSSRRRGPRSS